jgi:hypothetical protein
MTPVCDCGNLLCGLQSDPTDADLAGMCGGCWESLQAAKAKEALLDFRYRANEWFCDLSPGALERKAASYEDVYSDGPSFNEARITRYNVGKY